MPSTAPYPDVAPFAEWLGMDIVPSAPGEVILQLVQRAELNNRRGLVHGGVLATLLDSAMARAARTVEGVSELGGTVDLHVQFMLPGSGTLTAKAWVEQSTKTLAFCRGEVRDVRQVLIASAMATLRLRRA